MKKLKRFYKRHKDLIKKWADRLYEDSVPVYAAQATFYIIVASVPFVMLLITLVRYFIPVTRGDLIAAALSLVPENLEGFVTDIINELYARAPGSIISVAAITALWSASRGIIAVRRGLNRVCHLEVSRNYMRNRGMSILYTLIFVVILLFTLALLVFGNGIMHAVTEKYPAIFDVVNVIMRFKSILTVSILTLFFALIYKVLPSRKTTFRRQLPGAFFAAVGWAFFSFGYGIYIDNYSNYSYIYGSLAAIVLLMLWLYFCLNLILIGAEINEFIEEHVVFKK